MKRQTFVSSRPKGVEYVGILALLDQNVVAL